MRSFQGHEVGVEEDKRVQHGCFSSELCLPVVHYGLLDHSLKLGFGNGVQKDCQWVGRAYQRQLSLTWWNQEEELGLSTVKTLTAC